MNLENLFKEWVKEEGRKISRHKINNKEEAGAKRTYLHFDLRRPKSSLFSLYEEFINPVEISKHSFWPFLKTTINIIRLKQTNETTKGKHKDRKRRKEIKKRDVYYAAHYDAFVYSWYSFLLNKYYEKQLNILGISESVTAYRKIPIIDSSSKNKSSVNFAFDIFKFVKDKGECVVIVSDITKFFDSLDHELLKTEWKRLLGIENDKKLPNDHYTIYKNLTDFKFVDADEIFKKLNITFKKVVDRKDNHNIKIYKSPFRDGRMIKKLCNDKKEFINLVVKGGLIKGNSNKNNLSGSKRFGKKCGIMQGAPISATLANIYMMSFDKEINDYASSIGGIYRRYSDDVIIVCDIDNYKKCIELIQISIKKYELEINSKKTCITLFLKNKSGKIRGFDELYLNNNDDKEEKFYKNAQYLGFEYNGQNAFLRSSSLAKYYRKMKLKIKKAVNMAYGKRSKTKNESNRIFKKMLFNKYLHKGGRSFVSYAYRAISISKSMLGIDSIRKQLSRRTKIMNKEIVRRELVKTNKKKH